MVDQVWLDSAHGALVDAQATQLPGRKLLQYVGLCDEPVEDFLAAGSFRLAPILSLPCIEPHHVVVPQVQHQVTAAAATGQSPIGIASHRFDLDDPDTEIGH